MAEGSAFNQTSDFLVDTVSSRGFVLRSVSVDSKKLAWILLTNDKSHTFWNIRRDAGGVCKEDLACQGVMGCETALEMLNGRISEISCFAE